MFNFDYPKVKHSLARTALEDPYPAMYLDTRGVIRGANLMAFWLWNELFLSEPIRPTALLGRSIFCIYPHSFQRIPIELNTQFYTKKSSIVKRMKVDVSLESPIYDPFIHAMKTNAQLEELYEQAQYYADNEWEYPLNIMSPGQMDGSRLLEFRVTIYRLERDNGFLCMYTPTGSTIPEVEEQYGLLIKAYGDTAYVQLDNHSQNPLDNAQLLPAHGSPFRVYYPVLIQDPLWYISGENKAHQLLVGSSVVGAHFFDLFFAPQLRDWMGPVQETSAPRAIKYFTEFTSTFMEEGHEFHAEFEETMKRLLQLQDFRYMLDVSRKLPIRLYIPDNTDAPFYTCRVILPWPISPRISLQFRSMVKIIHRNHMVHSDIRDYQVTLVPENSETEVALILMHIQLASNDVYGDNSSLVTPVMQFLWLLNVMRTVYEGLLPGVDEADISWEPEPAFARIHDELVTELHERASDETDAVIAEFRMITEELHSREIADKENILEMLYNLTSNLGLEQITDFLKAEIDMPGAMGHN